MRHIPIRLGPLALLLAVISICMTTLGILAFTTARADLGLAQKYADTVQGRYALEYEGQDFLRLAGDAVAEGGELEALADTEKDEDGVIWKTVTRDETSLVIGLAPDRDRGYNVVSWRIIKIWNADEGMGSLWDGE